VFYDRTRSAPAEAWGLGLTSFLIKHLIASVRVVCTLRYAHLVNTVSRKTFERPDRSDPTLAVDNLNDLWPSQADAEVDPALAVSALQDLFPSRPPRSVSIVDAHLPAASDLALNADSLDDYFPDRDEAPTYVYDDESGLTVERESGLTTEGESGLTVERLCVESQIHRAAMEFQRFAVKFHAFASECQRNSRRAA
jgi:hypothetical protein